MMLTTDRRMFAKTAGLLGLGVASGGRMTVAAAAPPDAPPATLTTAGASADTAVPPLAPPDRQPPHVTLPEVVDKKLGWAIVGLGQLSIEEILPAFGQCKRSRLTAFVSGHRDKAEHLAKIHGVDRKSIYDYTSFESIADDASIDAVYIVLPNSMHAEYTIRALKAGKHVLCEKPMATTVADCDRMISAATEAGKMLGVAYRLHYEPLNIKAVELCQSGEIGKLKTISASNCQNTQAPNIRLSDKLGGGPVSDVGIYCINAANWITGEFPVSVSAFAHTPADEPRFAEVSESVAFTLMYPSGVIASCECSFGTTVGRRYRVNGRAGYVEMDPAFAYEGLKLTVKTGEESKGSVRIADIPLPQVDQFAAEMDAFSKAIVEEKTFRTPGAMGRDDIRIVTAVMEAARSGAVVRLT